MQDHPTFSDFIAQFDFLPPALLHTGAYLTAENPRDKNLESLDKLPIFFLKL